MSYKERYTKNYIKGRTFNIRLRLFFLGGLFISFLIARLILMPLHIIEGSRQILVFMLASGFIISIVAIIYAYKMAKK